MPSTETRALFRPEHLCEFMASVLRHYGMPEDDAELAARIFNDADLAGIETHGIAQFPVHWLYVKGLQLGVVDPRPKVTVLRETPAIATWDAGKGLGPVIAHRAMTAAIEKARNLGVGMISVRNGRHAGALGYFARMAAEQGMLGMVMCHTGGTTFPPGGTRPAAGTNPIAFAAPVPDSHPFSLDMSTTAIAGSNLAMAKRRGTQLPPGCAVDAQGQPTTSPYVRDEGGSLLYLGATAEGGGHKGFGLALMVDVMSGLLSGTGSGLWQRYSPEWQMGHLFGAWSIEAFVDPQEFATEMKKLINHIHETPPAPGVDRVRVPGDRSHETRARRLREGIPLDASVVTLCRELGDSLGIDFPKPLKPAAVPR